MYRSDPVTTLPILLLQVCSFYFIDFEMSTFLDNNGLIQMRVCVITMIAAAMQAEIDSFAGAAVAVLVDSKLPGSAGGGTGVAFDWTLALAIQRPVLVSQQE